MPPARIGRLKGRGEAAGGREQEAAAVGCPWLRLVDAVGLAHDLDVLERGHPVGDGEVADQHLPGLPAFRERIGLGMGPHDLSAVRGPVGVKVVVGHPARRWVRLAVVGIGVRRQPVGMGTVLAHDIEVAAVAAEAGGASMHRLLAVGVEQDPVGLWTLLGEGIGTLDRPAGEALLVPAVEVRAIDLAHPGTVQLAGEDPAVAAP